MQGSRLSTRCRSSSCGPAFLQGRNNFIALVTKAKALELLTLCRCCCFSCFFPLSCIDVSRSFLKLFPPTRIFAPPLVESYAPSVFNEIGIPVLPPTNPSISRFQFSNTSFRLIVGSGKLFAIITLDQIGSGIGDDMQKVFQILAFFLAECSFCQVFCSFGSPMIKAQTDLFIGDTQ